MEGKGYLPRNGSLLQHTKKTTPKTQAQLPHSIMKAVKIAPHHSNQSKRALCKYTTDDTTTAAGWSLNNGIFIDQNTKHDVNTNCQSRAKGQ